MRTFFLQALILSGCFTGCTPEADKGNQLDSFFSSLYDAKEFNGNVLIADKGEVIFQKSFGKANREKNLDLNAESIFELASLSKQFTAMGIIILAKQQKIAYSDSLRKFFPQLPYQNITLRHLMNHTSGLPDYIQLFQKYWDPTRVATNDDVISLLSGYKPDMLFKPGSKFAYSNTGYALLASVIAKVSGQTYGSFLKQNIFDPLAMKRTLVFSRRYEKKELDNYAFGYIYDENLRKYVLPDSSRQTARLVYMLDGIHGDGCVNSTTTDLLKWDRALYTEKLVSKSAFKEAITPGLLNDGNPTQAGFGWFMVSTKNFGMVTNHGGEWPGYTTFIERLIDYDKTIIILQNQQNKLPDVTKIRQILFGQPEEMIGAITTRQ